MDVDPQEEKQFRDDFNRIMNNNQQHTAEFGYPSSESLQKDYESLDHFYSDDELEKVVKELLNNSHRLDASDITVIAHSRDVTLSGTVKSQAERDCALSIVKLVHGVGEVNSELIVKTHGGVLPTDFGRDDR